MDEMIKELMAMNPDERKEAWEQFLLRMHDAFDDEWCTMCNRLGCSGYCRHE